MYQVRTTIKGVRMPDGEYIPEADTVVTLSEAEFLALDPALFTRGWLVNLGLTDNASVSSAGVAVALALVLGG